MEENAANHQKGKPITSPPPTTLNNETKQSNSQAYSMLGKGNMLAVQGKLSLA